jgi:hypothetical protein
LGNPIFAAINAFVGLERITYKADDGPNSPGLFEIGNGITILLFPTLLRAVDAGEVKKSDFI